MTALDSKPKRKFDPLSLFKFNYFTLKGIIVLVIVLSAVQLYVSNRYVTDGEKIAQDQTQTKALEIENLNLQDKIGQLSSLGYIEKQAQELGFVKIAKVEFLDQPAVIASR